jgi:OmpA family
MFKRTTASLVLAAMCAIAVSAQGLDTSASKDDWEEINFDFNSSVLSDGYPSLLRLSELLQKNPGYHVRLEGHTDDLGGGQYNDKLGLARANTVRDFLVKYGARSSQIEVGTRGKADPKYPGQKQSFSRTDEPRWMNRRVVMTVTDDQGRTVSAAGVGEAIRAMEPKQTAGMTDCCSEVLKRLDKLDDIARLLQNLSDQNAQLRRDVDALKQQQQVLESKANQPAPAPPSNEDIQKDVEKAVDTSIAKNQQPKFQLLGVNVGADQDGHVTATGRGRFFGVFGDHYAIQAQAEYMYFHTQKEGQFDIGLVDRIGRFQGGLFTSIKTVSLSGNQTNGTLGQAAFTMDYLFHWGKVGVFGTYAFLNNAVINTAATVLPNGIVSPDLTTQTYLQVVNQAGASATVGLWGNNYVEGSVSYLKSQAYGDRAGATLRFVFPISQHIGISVEGDLNPTMVGPNNTGEALVGVIFGNAMRPKSFMSSETPVPMTVPRVQWEQVTRNIRTGHTPPVADAGPNQIGVPAGPITLNASASYSPDELPLKYQWYEDGGPPITLTSPESAITSFVAAAGQSYQFRVVVTDSLGGQGQARVTVTTAINSGAAIGFFIANPSTIQAGQSSTLQWQVTGASSVSISGIGTVAPTGSSSVAPTSTTTYTLTAISGNSSVTKQVTVVVNGSATQVLFCYASPATIIAGESSMIYYQTSNATTVSITPAVGMSGVNGNVAVTPTATTTYTVVANGAGGATNSCSATVTVSTGQVPRIIQFSAAPQNITSGQSTTLTWAVENATSVSINNGVGNSLSLGGTQSVSPTANTTYTLTATNAAGTVTSTATVNVSPAPRITSFTASPNPSPSSGSNVTLTCSASNATSINLNGSNTNGASATLNVAPLATTTYTCIATSAGGQTVQQSLTVTVPAPSTGTGGGGQQPVIVIQGGNTVNTIFRFITLNASGTYSPAGNTPLSYVWVAVNNNATITNANSATPSVTLGLTSGVYLFQVTVTDSKGNQATALVTVNFTI